MGRLFNILGGETHVDARTFCNTSRLRRWAIMVGRGDLPMNSVFRTIVLTQRL